MYWWRSLTAIERSPLSSLTKASRSRLADEFSSFLLPQTPSRSAFGRYSRQEGAGGSFRVPGVHRQRGPHLHQRRGRSPARRASRSNRSRVGLANRCFHTGFTQTPASMQPTFATLAGPRTARSTDPEQRSGRRGREGRRTTHTFQFAPRVLEDSGRAQEIVQDCLQDVQTLCSHSSLSLHCYLLGSPPASVATDTTDTISVAVLWIFSIEGLRS
jgi:hypothetical protein